MLQLKAPSRKEEKQEDQPTKPSPREVSLVVRIVLAIVFFILGFTFSNEVFFDEYPLFGRPFLAEFVISLLMGVVGFYLVPKAFSSIKHWVQKVTFEAVSTVVTNFWDQQAERMRDARKDREARKQVAKEQKLKETLQSSMLLDTSVLIDGRIVDIAKTGFLMCDLTVPDFVIDELHALADSKDNLKRRKGRRGLDLLKALKKHAKVHVTNVAEGTKANEDGVDKALVEYAKKYKMTLVTLDFNLNKVASVSGVKVININDLANALRMKLLPGEELEIKIVDEGQEKDQGVGYLEDGTMVVVAKGRNHRDSKVTVRVKKSIQGSAGRMFFAELC